MLTVCYINRQPGKGYHYSDTNACGESAASKNSELKITLLLVNIIITTECQHSQNSAVGL